MCWGCLEYCATAARFRLSYFRFSFPALGSSMFSFQNVASLKDDKPCQPSAKTESLFGRKSFSLPGSSSLLGMSKRPEPSSDSGPNAAVTFGLEVDEDEPTHVSSSSAPNTLLSDLYRFADVTSSSSSWKIWDTLLPKDGRVDAFHGRPSVWDCPRPLEGSAGSGAKAFSTECFRGVTLLERNGKPLETGSPISSWKGGIEPGYEMYHPSLRSRKTNHCDLLEMMICFGLLMFDSDPFSTSDWIIHKCELALELN